MKVAMLALISKAQPDESAHGCSLERMFAKRPLRGKYLLSVFYDSSLGTKLCNIYDVLTVTCVRGWRRERTPPAG